MAKVIGKRILPGGNIIIKNITNGSGKDISTPLIIKEDKIKSPFKVITQEKIINQDVSVSSFGNGLSNVIGTSSREIHFRKFIGSGITEISLLGYDVKISAARATIETSSLGGVSLGLAVSAGTGNRNELRIRGLTGGGIIEVSALANSIVISAANTSLTLSSLGTGTNIITTISGSEIIQRRVQGAGSIDVRTSSNGVLIISSLGTTFVESNFRLIAQRNFVDSPGTLLINSDLSAYNEIYITMFNIAPSASNAALAFRLRINGTWISTGNLYRFHNITFNDTLISSNLLSVNQTEITGNLDNGGSTKRRRAASGFIRLFSPNNLNIASAATSWISEMRWIAGVGIELYRKTVGRNLYSTSVGTKLEGIEIFINGADLNMNFGLVKVYGRL
ncbi:MAG: hypothetical protein QXG00_08625 [Candidatus Woesearchaeota archaeon]